MTTNAILNLTSATDMARNHENRAIDQPDIDQPDPDRIAASHRWQAVLDRDANQDGTFVFAVSSTGVYCRRGVRAGKTSPFSASLKKLKGPVTAPVCAAVPKPSAATSRQKWSKPFAASLNSIWMSR
jgi:hypothetical protein